MKQAIFCLSILAIMGSSDGQVPQAFNYQAILRNTDGTVKANEAVAIQISIIHGHTDGPPVYLEVHNTTTSALGMVNLVIGEGETSDDLSTIDWANGPYFLDVAVNDVRIGTSPLLSVPYALHAKTAEDAATKAYVDTLKMILFQTLDPADLFNAGADISDLLDNGYSVSDLVSAGISISELVAAGISLSDLFEAGVLVGTMEQMGIDSTDLANAGLIGTVADYEGNQYKWVRIGDQVWMAKNLRATKYSDGTAIPNVTAWSNPTTPAYCWYNNDSTTYSDQYGALYNWYAVDTVSTGERNLCPAGWHVPADAEWTTLTNFLGGTGVAGGKLKETDTKHWNSPNTGATNETGFTALPGGLIINFGWCENIGRDGYWWSTTEFDSELTLCLSVSNVNNRSLMEAIFKDFGLSVRCLRD